MRETPPARDTSARRHGPARESGPGYWLYGWHAVRAALHNPQRRATRLLSNHAPQKCLELLGFTPRLPIEIVSPAELSTLTGRDAVHQGIALRVMPLETLLLHEILDHAPARGTLLLLDQVSDPNNVGALLRSAAAFSVHAVIAPKDHSAPETGAMAKAACGALDLIPRGSVTNLAQAIMELQEAGWWVIGLDGSATRTLAQAPRHARTALVLGAEGAGLRRLTRERCDLLTRLPIAPAMESLNVSNAAAIALYELGRENGDD